MKRGNIGGHVSAAGGAYKAIENAERIGAETIQIFGASPRQWAVKPLAQEDAQKFLAAKEKSRVKTVYLHAPYLINLASPNPELIAKSIENFVAHMEIAGAINANGVVVHVGSANGADKKEGMKRAVVALKEVLRRSPKQVPILLENAASSKRIGADIAELAFLYKQVGSKRVKICIDTAHAFAGGLLKDFSKKELQDFFQEFDSEIGLSELALLHINDSKSAYESNSDRHENIGEGQIGLKAFQNLAKIEKAAAVDWILEVPGFKNEGPDKKNVDILKACYI